ncbi:hypothetical protein MMC29_000876 [Sticta canariensis]|nr:hypothetical protein [Sticta canariensis]
MLSVSGFASSHVTRLHPGLLLVTQVVLIVAVTGFTSPSSIIRLSLLPFMALCSWSIVLTSLKSMHRGPWAAFVGGSSLTFLLQYISTALLSRWSFVTSGPSSGTPPQDLKQDRDRTQEAVPEMKNISETLGARLKFGFLAATSFRYSGTPYEVRNVPRFSAQDPNFAPSRKEFLRRKAITILICCLALDFLNLGADPESNAINLSPERVPLFTRLSDVTGQELIMRLFVTLGFGAGVYIFQTGIQSIFALVDVGLGLSEVKSWRPLFGSPWDAYTVRRFWR